MAHCIAWLHLRGTCIHGHKTTTFKLGAIRRDTVRLNTMLSQQAKEAMDFGVNLLHSATMQLESCVAAAVKLGSRRFK